jgi:type I restriction enzyme R subunit
VQLLLNFRDTIESDRKKAATDLGLNETEFAFHNILVAEVARVTKNESLDETTHDEVIQIVKALVAMMNQVTGIVDFFKKQDEVKGLRKNIRRAIVASSFYDEQLEGVLAERFMELAKVKFK